MGRCVRIGIIAAALSHHRRIPTTLRRPRKPSAPPPPSFGRRVVASRKPHAAGDHTAPPEVLSTDAPSCSTKCLKSKQQFSTGERRRLRHLYGINALPDEVLARRLEVHARPVHHKLGAE